MSASAIPACRQALPRKPAIRRPLLQPLDGPRERIVCRHLQRRAQHPPRRRSHRRHRRRRRAGRRRLGRRQRIVRIDDECGTGISVLERRRALARPATVQRREIVEARRQLTIVEEQREQLLKRHLLLVEHSDSAPTSSRANERTDSSGNPSNGYRRPIRVRYEASYALRPRAYNVGDCPSPRESPSRANARAMAIRTSDGTGSASVCASCVLPSEMRARRSRSPRAHHQLRAVRQQLLDGVPLARLQRVKSAEIIVFQVGLRHRRRDACHKTNERVRSCLRHRLFRVRLRRLL